MCQVVKNSSHESGIRGKKRMRKIASSDMIHSIAILLKNVIKMYLYVQILKKNMVQIYSTRWYVMVMLSSVKN